MVDYYLSFCNLNTFDCLFDLVDCSPSFRAQMKKQLDLWSADGVLDRCSPSQRTLLWLLAGDMDSLCTLSLSWVERFGILLWYCNETTVPVSAIVAELLQWIDCSVHSVHSVQSTQSTQSTQSITTTSSTTSVAKEDEDDLGLALVKLFWSMQTNGQWGVTECLKNGGKK